AAAVTEDNFLVHDAGDLADLCSAGPSDALYTAATNFCHGFALGAFRILQDEVSAEAPPQMFCLTNPSPSRNEAIAGFVRGVRADPARARQPGDDAIATFLSQRYPCPRKK